MPQQKKNKALPIEPEHRSPAGISTVEAIIFSAGIVLLLFLIYTIREIASPFIVLGAILFLLYPLRSNAMARNIMWLSAVLFSLWFFYSIIGTLAPFVAAMLFAYILHPMITKIETWGIPRWASSLVIILCGIAVLIVVVVLVLPIAFAQFSGILEAASKITNDFTNWMFSNRMEVSLRKYGISTQQLRDMLTTSFAPRLEVIMKGLLEGTFGLVSGLSTVDHAHREHGDHPVPVVLRVKRFSDHQASGENASPPFETGTRKRILCSR